MPRLNTYTRRLRRFPRYSRSRLASLAGLPNSKVFCIGRNKTGTTSVKAALQALGYRVGRQRDAELLMEDWGRRDFSRLIDYCHGADAFQDIPFSLDYTFQAMDAAFPGSKFILTVRDSADQWYQSLVKYESMRMHKRAGSYRLPTPEEIRSDPYVYQGWLWRSMELIWGREVGEAFDEARLKAHYEAHNARILDYFRHRASDLLVLNVAAPDAMQRLCGFLGRNAAGLAMPWLNQSK